MLNEFFAPLCAWPLGLLLVANWLAGGGALGTETDRPTILEPTPWHFRSSRGAEPCIRTAAVFPVCFFSELRDAGICPS